MCVCVCVCVWVSVCVCVSGCNPHYDIKLIISFYKQLDVPHSVSKRCGHSLSVFIMSPHCVWIITVGGLVDTETLVTFPNIVMLTELGKYMYL